ncbi:MAG: NADH-quinone oxidoreductase subunit N [Bdellovibrionales bacterium]|nr:NADH-quinone oxidoreductase subunit N [Bdellovibrionales bacterium]
METQAAQTLIRSDLLTLTQNQMEMLLPYAWVFVGAAVALVLSVIRFISPKWPVFIVSLLTLGGGVWATEKVIHGERLLAFNNMMIFDHYSSVFNILFLVSAAVTVLASFRYLDKEGLQYPEYYVLILFSALGMMLMASSIDLVVMFIALELMSLAVYSLVGFRRADRKSNEAAMKYFVLGSAASAILLYGVALLYGSTGSTNILDILATIEKTPALVTPVFSVGAWLVMIGFLFKVASVPFHMWMPDVYEGSPAPITGFMTTGLKAAAFATFIRVTMSLGYGKSISAVFQHHMHDALWVCAVLTMVIGNLVALAQVNLKRMLAYSSIAHTGYLLIGLIVGPGNENGYSPMIVYLIAYAAMNLGAFVVMSMLAGREDHGLNLHDLAGLSSRRPWLAFAMVVFLFSLAGIPPTAGFAGKYMLLYSAVQAGEIPLVVIAVLCSAISVYYYLRVIVYMYMKEPAGSPANARASLWSALATTGMVAITMIVGLQPSQVLNIAKKAVNSLVVAAK